ncbi:MAG: hypothetical protein II319_02205 [Clostridia bacterium]|jgi:hypothetical protein|nr:hypothetical protein [Clostridia bacterium]
MVAITLKNIYDCYEYGKRVANGELDNGTAAKKVAKTGMNEGSAQIYIRCVCSMIRGERYTGTVKTIAVTRFLTNINSDYGFDGLRRALESLRMHLDYQKSYNTLDDLKRIYEEFMDILP